MTDLIEQIRAAIDHAEQLARYAGGTGGWAVHGITSHSGGTT